MGSPKPWDRPWEDSPGPLATDVPPNYLGMHTATWAVTNPCNLHCAHCYDATGAKRADLTTAQALLLLDRLAVLGIDYLVMSGGEPLLRKDLFQLLERCGELEIQCGLRSNATLITNSIAQRLASFRLAVVGVSLDGATEDTHDAIRGRGAFRKAQTGIDALCNAHISVKLEVTLSKNNAHESHRFIQLAEELQVEEVIFSAMVPQGRATALQGALLDHSLWQELVTSLRTASLTTRVKVSHTCALTGACLACVEPNITCDGWLTPCYYMPTKKLFNLLDTPVADIRTLLTRHRPSSIDGCGRGHWTYETLLPEASLM